MRPDFEGQILRPDFEGHILRTDFEDHILRPYFEGQLLSASWTPSPDFEASEKNLRPTRNLVGQGHI